MAKFLLIIAAFIVFYLLLRNHAKKAGRVPSQRADAKHEENMVRCRLCGVHLPTSEAVTSRGEFFCSREHLQLADRDGDKR